MIYKSILVFSALLVGNITAMDEHRDKKSCRSAMCKCPFHNTYCVEIAPPTSSRKEVSLKTRSKKINSSASIDVHEKVLETTQTVTPKGVGFSSSAEKDFSLASEVLTTSVTSENILFRTNSGNVSSNIEPSALSVVEDKNEPAVERHSLGFTAHEVEVSSDEIGQPANQKLDSRSFERRVEYLSPVEPEEIELEKNTIEKGTVFSPTEEPVTDKGLLLKPVKLKSHRELEKIYQLEDYEEGKDPEEEKDNDDKENEEENGSENKAQKLARNKRKKGILLNSRMPLRHD